MFGGGGSSVRAPASRPSPCRVRLGFQTALLSLPSRRPSLTPTLVPPLPTQPFGGAAPATPTFGAASGAGSTVRACTRDDPARTIATDSPPASRSARLVQHRDDLAVRPSRSPVV